MIKRIALISLLLCMQLSAALAQEFLPVPRAWKWVSQTEAAFSFDGSFADSSCISISLPTGEISKGVSYPPKFSSAPLKDSLARNITFSPDSSKLAFTRHNDLYVYDIASGKETRLTFDGGPTTLNGYASWVYYEEIFGRASRYKAFWWSPDSRKLAWYRFDESSVPMFPIYSPFGQDGTLLQTRYPKAGEHSPEVEIFIADIRGIPAGASKRKAEKARIKAAFPDREDCWYGTPFWSPDSKGFYVPKEPRVQQELDLFRVDAERGSIENIYHESCPTWLSWPEDMLFSDKGLYMVRNFEGPWQQIFFLSYDGKQFKRLSDGPNRRTRLLKANSETGEILFVSNRDASMRAALYKLDAEGNIVALTDPALNAAQVVLSPDGSYFAAALSNYSTPTRVVAGECHPGGAVFELSDAAGPKFDPSRYSFPEIWTIKAEDGQEMPAAVTLPLGFDPSKKYPVHFEIYGGPGTAYVRDYWRRPSDESQWFARNGIISVIADCRAAGHTGRAGTDLVFKDLLSVPVRDFLAWAAFFKSLDYVDGEHIGVEGFSFGGTMTATLLLAHSDVFRCGIAGGGVYDWRLYDSHYTERFMLTPELNPEGYEASRVISFVKVYPRTPGGGPDVMLRLTHGTGDDNVHFQNTLQLVDALQRAGKDFELMIYPDGMHGYRGAQHVHSLATDHIFWLKHLKGCAPAADDVKN